MLISLLQFEKMYPHYIMEMNNCAHSPIVRKKSSRKLGNVPHSLVRLISVSLIFLMLLFWPGLGTAAYVVLADVCQLVAPIGYYKYQIKTITLSPNPNFDTYLVQGVSWHPSSTIEIPINL